MRARITLFKPHLAIARLIFSTDLRSLCNSMGSSPDPSEAMKSFISTRPTWSNTTRYYNEELTAMIEKGQQTIDGKWYIMDEDGKMLTEPVTLTPDKDGALQYPGLAE